MENHFSGTNVYFFFQLLKRHVISSPSSPLDSPQIIINEGGKHKVSSATEQSFTFKRKLF